MAFLPGARFSSRAWPWRLVLCISTCLESACAPELVSTTGSLDVTVASEDGRELDALSRAPRLRVQGMDPEQAVPDLRLFQGEISAYANNRLRRREVIATLAKREVPLSVWTELGDVLAAPAALLTEGERYSLAALGRGTLAEVVIAEEGAMVLERLWPPAVHPQGEIVYCLEGAATLEGQGPSSSIAVAPFATAVQVAFGVGEHALVSDRCVSLRPEDGFSGDFLLPPPSLEGFVFDPEPVPVWSAEGAPSAPPAPSCEEEEAVMGEVCGRFEGTELTFEASAPSAWFVRAEPSGGGAPTDWFRVAVPGQELIVHPFEPWTEYELFVHRLDDRGAPAASASRATSGEPRAHVVINEVLSNPIGPEPQSEWVELVNVGAASAFLGGWALEDSTGSTLLPDVEIPAGRYGLIVAIDYSALGDDVVPLPDAIAVVVERVGHRGLSNGGEPLRLVDASGRVVSSVPALAASRAGTSVARRDPWSPDDSDAFGGHAPPGASPGGPNQVE